ncbi:hypothetical protein DAEQUDRAFT_721644 [Daedalea quercina L-15889]|uniref:Cytochrome c oxidase, subunit VIb n=1 Tax=Daedalea quercina L-15889 TaxID=1314783 RepID=A0A165TKM3_9APHY|nr:hypothetical protein DAEQUDRAFT_721644 [Daedalea quercina L-15889]
MGWFSNTKTPEKPDPASRNDRQKCWDSRDAYFTCLDGANVVKPGDESSVCDGPKAAYERNCAKSWIDYFNKRRVLAEQQQGILAQANNRSSVASRR